MARWSGDKRKAVARVGLELEARGWKLYGWSADQSDAMTDYYCPESWDGVAERDGFVACVDVSSYTARSSGGRDLCRPVPDAECPRCKGAKVDPSGWTFQKAKADPQAFNADFAGPGCRMLFADVVSPLHFFGCGPYGGDYPDGAYGAERCRTCSGAGHTFRSESYVEPWPTFQANPKGASWHVEKGGQIVARGSGVFSIEDGDSDADRKARASALVDRIEASTRQPGAPWPLLGVQVEGASVTESATHPGNVEVRFPAKPSQEVIAALKSSGFRWYRPGALWYGKAERLPGGVLEPLQA